MLPFLCGIAIALVFKLSQFLVFSDKKSMSQDPEKSMDRFDFEVFLLLHLGPLALPFTEMLNFQFSCSAQRE